MKVKKVMQKDSSRKAITEILKVLDGKTAAETSEILKAVTAIITDKSRFDWENFDIEDYMDGEEL